MEFENNTKKIPLVFLHGFSGSAEDWEDFFPAIPETFIPLSLDLPGHGKNVKHDSPEYYSVSSTVSIIKEFLSERCFNKAVLAGYSMGGRAALCFSVRFPNMVKGLFLESSSPGIIGEDNRDARRASDNRLADFIENSPIEDFVDFWLNIPLFESQKKLPLKKLEKIKAQKLNNDKKGLADSLRFFGTGIMPPLWDSLPFLEFPVSMISGSLDVKFSNINREMNEIIPDSEHLIIENCGHNIHLENPEEYLNVLLMFLKKLEIS